MSGVPEGISELTAVPALCFLETGKGIFLGSLTSANGCGDCKCFVIVLCRETSFGRLKNGL